MASTTGTTDPYAYVKASEMATRTLISPDDKPAKSTTSSSHDHADGHEKPVLTRKQTDNYEQAAAAAARDGKGEGIAALSGTDRPGLGRQQSWSMQDKRRQHHEGLLGGQPSGQGYHSTGQ